MDFDTYVGPTATKYEIPMQFHDMTQLYRYALTVTHACDENNIIFTIEVDADSSAAAQKIAREHGFFIGYVLRIGTHHAD